MMLPASRLRLLLALLLGLLSFLPSQAGKPRLGTINIARAFEAYHLTIAEKERVREAREKLQQDPRPETIKLLEVELKDLRNQAQDPALNEEQRRQHYQRYMVKHHEHASLKREHEHDRSEKLEHLNKGMVQKTRELLHDVQKIVGKIAEEEGIDHVFEVSGKSSSQLPSLIYIRNATDLTDRVIEELNRNQPEKEPPSSASGQAG